MTGNKALYQTIADRLPLFFRPWWLDMVCTGWDVAVAADEQGNITAVFPYQLEQKWGLRLLRNPMLTPYLGPYILCTKDMPDGQERWEQEEEQIRLLLQQIPRAAYFQFHAVPGFTAFLPFLHQGFRNTNRITYRMDLRLTEEELLSRMQKRRRRYIRNADTGLEITDGMPYLDEFFRMHRQTFEKKGQPYRYDPAFLRKLIEKGAAEHSSRFWAITADGKPSGMLWVVYDRDTMYQLLSTFPEGGGNPAAVSLLTWHAITEAKKMGLATFDFEGSIDPGIEQFFRKFGGDRHHFLAFEKTTSLFWKIKKHYWVNTDMMDLLIVAPFTTPRLEYVLDWIFREQLQVNYRIAATADDTVPLLFYGQQVTGALSVPACGLLQEAGIRPQQPATGRYGALPALFAVDDPAYSLSFDLFSAVFYLLSRYEEYLPYTADLHGRYPVTESILYREAALDAPLVDQWLFLFRQLLQQHGIATAPGSYSYLPTYDIDIAWSYRHKGWKRNLGGYLRSLMSGDMAGLKERYAVLQGSMPDPFDSFGLLEDLHRDDKDRPVYFILSALEPSDFDKNISPQHPAMQQLLRRLAEHNRLGIHPSYDTDHIAGRAAAELQVLQQVTGRKIILSRQHYIKVQLPATYRILISLGITDDYSMGYSTVLGFRAGTSHSFYWYDLQQEQCTMLRAHPFCFMDATAHYELGLDAGTAFERLRQLRHTLQQLNGRLVTVFHNFSLGTAAEWQGWAEQYAAFLAAR